MALALLPDRQYTAPSAANAVAITPSGVAWTNSAYVELLAAMPAAGVLTGVVIYTTDGQGNSVAYDAEIDIATGAAGAEVVVATVRIYNNRVFSSTQTAPSHVWALPIPIDNLASGARVAARMRKNNTNVTAWQVAITYLLKPLTTTTLTTAVAPKPIPPAAVGVTVTAGSPAWASGTWVTVRAATGAALVLTAVEPGGLSAAGDYEVDLGTGTAGAEVVITTLRISTSNNQFGAGHWLPNPLDNVGAGVRLAARLRCSTASATARVSVTALEKPL